MDACSPSKFTLPISFPGSSGRGLIEAALSRSKTSVLKCWGYHHISETNSPVRACALGSQDGSLFLFHGFPSRNNARPARANERSRSRRGLSPLDLTRAVPTSPTSLSPTGLHFTPRSRVVSGITTEQAEAPKVYVDFEDEAGKLKNMLEGKAPKEKAPVTETDLPRTNSDSALTSKSETASLKGREHAEHPRFVHSSVTSPIPSPKLIPSTPVLSYDTLSSKQKMTLIAHIIPSPGGAGHSVKAIIPVNNGTMFVVLQESGDVRAFSTRDGACVASAHVDESPIGPLKRTGDKGQYHDTCLWRALQVTEFPDVDEGSVAFTAGEEQLIGALQLDGPLQGIRTRHEANRVSGLVWSCSCIKGFVCTRNDFNLTFEQSLPGFTELDWASVDLYCVIYHNRAALYKLQAVNADGDPPIENTFLKQPSHYLTLKTGAFDALAFPSPGEIIYTNTLDNGQRQILRLFKSADGDNGTEVSNPRTIWQTPRTTVDIPQPTSLLSLEDNIFIQGYADGSILRCNLSQLSGIGLTSTTRSDSCMNGEITCLHVVQNQRTKEKFVVSGASDGSIAFWAINSLVLCARWIPFTTPLCQVIQLPIEKTGPLRGCLLCIAQDGTVAVIVLDDFQFLYMIPGSVTSLNRVCLAETSLLLMYKDKRARLWDTESKVFWRSLTQDKAEELLPQGGWTEMFLSRQDDGRSTFKVACDGYHAPDAASIQNLDLERFLSDSASVIKTISTNRDQTRAVYSRADQLKLVLSVLLTPGLNDSIDDICQTKLCIPTSSALLGYSSPNTVTVYPLVGSREAWCISSRVSAARLVAITAVLRTLSLFEEYAASVNTVAAFYATSLPGIIGSAFEAPDLCFLARLWLKSPGAIVIHMSRLVLKCTAELRPSCRTVFDAVATRLSDDEASVLVEEWQVRLPSLHGNASMDPMSFALALYLCGYIAVEKYSVISTEVLKDIAKSLALLLQDDKSLYRALAVDLCSRGFHVWQHYIDAMEILRSLFNLATTSKKDIIDVQNIGAQARSAVLNIASSNTPLFMTTLGLDILNPPSLEHRRAVLQIVAFLIRKRPLVLHSNLARLMEAVVKSLDPNATTDRDAVLDIATEVIGQVVKSFPNVDFHGGSQRLAVGSQEGAIIMYDLKTATRLYVLEGHKKKLTSCSFSPDGRRLVTVSLDEGLLHVWKVGSSFASFFMPGAPPRQGHSGSQPYKTLNFHFGDISEYINSLDSTKFEWVADRNLRVKIGPNTLFFST
ncbi:hypothetical protein M378DRAFT_73182 [Amanita muscaria Koide BX008]|uniref:Uncharacterized protein n=1 Tax=Amanita muscaria (strain Koide BX008) TaxID=946122 RepID=A0A0C2TKZ3_AMAMK|nr:hypothetical protein M378DRAFT_73182 [Amanita muscaria Koide BX008]